MIQLIEPKRVEIDGRRCYVSPFGALPSVTTILSATKPEEDRRFLEQWCRDNPDLSKAALERGTRVHSQLEQHLKGEVRLDSSDPDLARFAEPLAQFDKVLALEAFVYNPVGYAGSLDCLAVVDGCTTLVDFKTSRRGRSASQIGDYFLQCSAYIKAVEYLWDIEITHSLILISASDRKKIQRFRSNREEIEQHWQQFLERLRQYQELNGGDF